MRLVTRGDLDGLTCAVLITTRENDRRDPARPSAGHHRQDGCPITGDDILANLPYQAGCGKWFDHHLLTESNERPPESFEGRYGLAPSAARVVYEYYIDAAPRAAEVRAAARRDRPPRLRPAHHRRRARPEGLHPARLHPRPAHRAGRVPGLLPEAGRLAQGSKPIEEIMELPEVQERVHADPRAGRRRSARRRSSTLAPRRQRGVHRLPRGEPAARGQPLPRLHAVPAGEHLRCACTGARSREHVAAGGGPLDLQPHQPHQRGQADVPLRRRRPPRRRAPACCRRRTPTRRSPRSSRP